MGLSGQWLGSSLRRHALVPVAKTEAGSDRGGSSPPDGRPPPLACSHLKTLMASEVSRGPPDGVRP